MPAFKLYEWEHKQFPWHKSVKVRADLRIYVTRAITALYGFYPEVELTKYRSDSGTAYGDRKIRLPIPKKDVNLGVIIHEIAHCYTSRTNGPGHGHNKTFKRNLIKIYIETRKHLKRIFDEARQRSYADQMVQMIEQEGAKRKAKMLAEAEASRAERVAALRRLRESRAYRIQHLERRIKRLESRRKRIETLLKSARRSRAMLIRFEEQEQKWKAAQKIEGEIAEMNADMAHEAKLLTDGGE